MFTSSAAEVKTENRPLKTENWPCHQPAFAGAGLNAFAAQRAATSGKIAAKRR
jgi:hypothetical protein